LGLTLSHYHNDLHITELYFRKMTLFNDYRLKITKILVSNLVLLSLAFNTSVVTGQPLEKEINQLMLLHPEIIAEHFKVEIAKSEENAAFSNYYPVLNASAQTGFQSYQDTGRNVSSDLNHSKYRFELTQNLFKGQRDKFATAGAAANKSLKEWSALNVENDLIYKGISTYLNVMQYHEMLLIINNKVDVLKRFIDLKKQSQSSGAGTVIDIYEASLSLQQVQEQRLNIDGKYRAAFRQYQIIFEHDPVIGAMDIPRNLQLKVFESLEQALEIAKTNNAQLAMAEQRINIAEQEKKAVFGKYSPEIDVVAAYERETNFQGIEGAKTDRSVFVRLNWDFNMGNQIGDQYDSAVGKLSSEKYAFQAMGRGVIEQVKLAWEKKEVLQRRLNLSKGTMKIANDLYQARDKQNTKGSGNEVDLLNAKSQLLSARTALINVRFEALKASYELLHAIGLLQVEFKPGKSETS